MGGWGDHYERARGMTTLAEALRGAGWEIWGWTPDRSDSMTDYYAPASWDGVATKDGWTAVVYVQAGDRQHLAKSGGFQTSSPVFVPCEHCGGSGIDPQGWLLRDAQEHPEVFNADFCKRRGGGRMMFASVVSPLMFDGDGHEHCAQCSGSGRRPAGQQTHTDEPYPTFQPNPAGKNWHIEKDGQIVASGVGVKAIGEHHEQRSLAALARIMGAIRAAMTPKVVLPETPSTMALPPGSVQITEDRDWLWVAFPGQPAEAVLDGLRALAHEVGGGFSGKRGAWYFKSLAARPRVEALLQEATA